MVNGWIHVNLANKERFKFLKQRRKIAVITGAGISAESGIATFRGSGGLWEGYDVMKVASPEGWRQDFRLVLEFYNARRRNVANAKPNSAHLAIARLEKEFDVQIVTQNIDNLHEQAGSSKVLHLHGEITKSCSSYDLSEVRDIGFNDIEEGMLCTKGYQIRPFIVWFGEPVPMLEVGAKHVMEADVVIVIGTSLEVYPASTLVNYSKPEATVYVIDPNNLESKLHGVSNTIYIRKTATEGLKDLVKTLS
jgi:NAD-dependent deacetylase